MSSRTPVHPLNRFLVYPFLRMNLPANPHGLEISLRPFKCLGHLKVPEQPFQFRTRC
jgi:hypothetical protein